MRLLQLLHTAPTAHFEVLRELSVKNPGADSLTLGKFTGDADSYIVKAGDHSMYFDMGSEWRVAQDKLNLSDKEMFEYFNKPVLDDAITAGKEIRFSHNPLDYPDTSLGQQI